MQKNRKQKEKKKNEGMLTSFQKVNKNVGKKRP